MHICIHPRLDRQAAKSGFDFPYKIFLKELRTAARQRPIYGADPHDHDLAPAEIPARPAASCKQRPPHGARPSHKGLKQPVSLRRPREKLNLSPSSQQEELLSELSLTFTHRAPMDIVLRARERQQTAFALQL